MKTCALISSSSGQPWLWPSKSSKTARMEIPQFFWVIASCAALIPWANRKNRILVTWYGSSCAWTATIASLASKNLMLTTKKHIKKTDSIEWRGMRIFENFLWREKMHAVLDNFYVKSRVIVLTNTVIKWIKIENCFPEIIRKENICAIVYGRNGT